MPKPHSVDRASQEASFSKSTTKQTAKRVAYSVAAAAAGMSASGAAAAPDSSVAYSGIQDLPISQFSSQDLNLDGDAYNDILLKNYVFGGGNYQGLYVNFFPGKVVGFSTGLAYASALNAGDSIDAGATTGGQFQASMAYGANNPNAEFNNVDGAFLGLEFPINGTSHFGWIRVSIDNAAGTFVVNDWAYNKDPGEGLLAGQLPEPSTLGLLAAGAAGVASLRRRRQED